jgi:hypothetical protein
MAHTFYDEAITDEVKDLYAETGAWVCATIFPIGILTNEIGDVVDLFANDERVSSRVSESEIRKFRQKLVMKREGATLEHALESVRQLRAIGVDILA